MAISQSLYDLNQAIIRAFGLNPDDLRSFHMKLDRSVGPIITVEVMLRDGAGKPFMEDGELASVCKQFTLVERTESPSDLEDMLDLSESPQDG